MRQGRRRLLLRIYERLRTRKGHLGWWPGETAFEVCVGAILVQNTAWSNVERALGALKRAKRLTYRALSGLAPSQIAPFIRSAGTFNVKARRVAAFVAFLGSEYGGRVSAMAADGPESLRSKLLAVNGIGPETADSIALYAAGKPVFVVDGYTRRVFSRLGLVAADEPYGALQRFFADVLPQDAALYGDYHAQIVELAKDVCRPRPRCGECALGDICPFPKSGEGQEAGLRLTNNEVQP